MLSNAFAITLGLLVSASVAQAQAPRAAPVRTRTAPDLKTAVYWASDALGMLRTVQEVDKIVTIEFWATGSMNVNGRPCKLASYHAGVRWRPGDGGPHNDRTLPVPAMRTEFACADAAGKAGPRQIQVVAGEFAWNEDKPGVNGTPALESALERQQQIWTLIPESVMKAAVVAGGKAVFSNEAAMTSITFPMPPPFENATMKAILNPRIFRVDENPAGEKREFSHLIDKTELRIGNSVVETSYSNYGDWNDSDIKSLILLPKRIVQKRDGTTITDLTITKTYTYNPYIIMPVPENVRTAAGKPLAAGH